MAESVELRSSQFFDFSHFSHFQLFEGDPFPWEVLKKLETYLQTLSLGKIEGQVSNQAYLVHPHLISIGPGSIVEPGAYIQGPCWIGSGSTVRHGAYIRGNVLIGQGCVAGHDTEMKNAILLDGAHAAHFAYVGDSILGNKVNLGAGVKCANLKLDGEEVILSFQHQQIKTGLRKLGSMIGDGSQIGCNSVLNPGVLIGKQVKCYPCLNVGGFIPTGSTVKPLSGFKVVG